MQNTLESNSSKLLHKMRSTTYRRKPVLWVIIIFAIVMVLIIKVPNLCQCRDEYSASSVSLRMQKYKNNRSGNVKTFTYNRESPLIFIGGVPRSGTTIMRAMLDAHPDVRCGQETHILPIIFRHYTSWTSSKTLLDRLVEGGISKELFAEATANFFLDIIVNHGELAPRLCNKDPLLVSNGTSIIELFPNGKFLFMVRDGRATAHSIVVRGIGIRGWNNTSYRSTLQQWNTAISIMNDNCKEIGKDQCMKVYYEQLILHPLEWMKKILHFLDLPWNDAVLHHEDFINKPNGIVLSKVERSSSQVIKPVNLEALSKWVGQIPDDVVRDMAEIAPMLSILGYDPYANPPNYGKADEWVQNNTKMVKENREMWNNMAKEMQFKHLDGT